MDVKRSIRAGAVAGLLAIVPAAPALATPATVELRVEGPSATLFEGRVTTDVRTLNVGDGTGSHRCDGTNAGAHRRAGVTRGAVLAASGVPFRGTWNAQFESPTFASVAGTPVAFDAASQRYLAEYRNGRLAQLGACGDQVAEGDRVLFAYARGTEKLLALRGGGAGPIGGTTSLTVTDAVSGRPVAGARVAGQVTGPDGVARVRLDRVGERRLQASAPDAIRSNSVVACARRRGQRACGTRPTARLAKLRRSYRRGGTPRSVRGSARDRSGIGSLKLRVERRAGDRCAALRIDTGRFQRVRCGRARFVEVGMGTQLDVALPSALRRASYTVEAVATDRAGNRSRIARRAFEVR